MGSTVVGGTSARAEGQRSGPAGDRRRQHIGRPWGSAERRRRARARSAILLAGRVLAGGALAGCGGGERGTAPPPIGVARVVVTPAVPALAVGQTATLTAVALTTAGDTIRAADVTWATSADGVARLAPAGARVTVTAAGPGSAVVSATVAGQRAEVAVTVAAPAVTRLTAAWHHAALPTGQALPLGATATRSDGTAGPDAAITYRSTDPAVATVSAAGVVTGAAAGTALVIAQLGERADTAAVTITPGGLAVALDARDLAPGAPVRLAGPALTAGAQVTVAGAAVATTAAEGGVALTVPVAPFAPCLAPGQRLALTVSAGGQTATLQVPAREAPLPLALAAGQHAVVTEAVARGCAVALGQAGDYTVVPFTWDRTDRASGYQPPAPLATRLEVTPAVATIAAALLAHAAGAPTPAWRSAASAAGGVAHPPPPHAGLPHALDPRTLYAGRRSAAAVSAVTAACTLPAVGGTVPIYTVRGPDGVYQRISAAGPPEPWTVAATSARAVALYDSTMARVAQTDPAIGRRLGQFLAAYDSTVAPLFDRHAGGMPDQDGNGRLIVMLPYFVGNASGVGPGAGVVPTANTHARSDCDGARSEAVLLPSGVVVHDDRGPGQGAQVAAHEGAHVVDFSLDRPQGSLKTWWSAEGLAVLFEHLWAAGGAGAADAPLTSNLAGLPRRTIEGAAWGPTCAEPARAALPSLVAAAAGTPPGYRLACQFTSYVLQRGLAAGVPLPELVRRWMDAKASGGRLTLAQAFNTVLRAERAPADVLGAWLLSWAADDRVVGTDAALQDQALRLPGAPRDATFAAGQGGVLDATLAEPDARLIDVSGATAGTRVRYAAPDGTPLPAAGAGARTALAVLRVR